MTEPVAYLNGEFLSASQAKINIYDYGFIMGATFTEMTRTFRHRPFRASDHIARLFASLKYAGIAVSLSPDQMLDLTFEIAERNCQLIKENADLAIVHFVTPGENRIYAGTATTSTPLAPTVGIHTFPLAFAAWRHLFQSGAHVVTPSTRHLPPQCVDPKTKNRSRLHWWLAGREARIVDPQANALLLDLDGNITETAAANFLVFKNGAVFSPARNILCGVSLQTTRELSTQLGFDWIEKDLQLHDVVNADEAWLTTTPYCLAPVTRINGIAIGDGQIGPVFRALLTAWNERVGLDVRQQILGFGNGS